MHDVKLLDISGEREYLKAKIMSFKYAVGRRISNMYRCINKF
jgi:hypothetical protein